MGVKVTCGTEEKCSNLSVTNCHGHRITDDIMIKRNYCDYQEIELRPVHADLMWYGRLPRCCFQ